MLSSTCNFSSSSINFDTYTFLFQWYDDLKILGHFNFFSTVLFCWKTIYNLIWNLLSNACCTKRSANVFIWSSRCEQPFCGKNTLFVISLRLVHLARVPGYLTKRYKFLRKWLPHGQVFFLLTVSEMKSSEKLLASQGNRRAILELQIPYSNWILS